MSTKQLSIGSYKKPTLNNLTRKQEIKLIEELDKQQKRDNHIHEWEKPIEVIGIKVLKQEFPDGFTKKPSRNHLYKIFEDEIKRRTEHKINEKHQKEQREQPDKTQETPTTHETEKILDYVKFGRNPRKHINTLF